MTALSDLLNAAKEGGVRVAEAEDRIAGDPGVSMDRGTIYRYLRGDHPAHPAEDQLQALSVGFGIPITKVREAAGVQVGELGPYEPPAFASRLSRDQRRALNELIRTIVEVGGELEQRSAPMKDAPSYGIEGPEPPHLSLAADNPGTESEGSKRRRQQDEDAES